MKISSAIVLSIASLFSAAPVLAACGSSYCSGLVVEQYRATSSGLYIVVADDTDLDPLTICTPRVFGAFVGGSRKTLHASSKKAAFQEIKEAVMLSKLFGEPLFFQLYDDPNTGNPECVISWLTVQTTPASPGGG